MPKQAVLDFIHDPTSGEFEELALRAFRFRYDAIPPFRALCDAHATTPAAVTSSSDAAADRPAAMPADAA